MIDSSYLTAISRSKPSRPLRYLLANQLVKGRVLDYGCGRGFDAAYLNADKYDPYYFNQQPEGAYDTILCFFVLNVLSRSKRTAVKRHIKQLLKPGGKAYIAVRNDNFTEGKTSKGTFQWKVKLRLPMLVSRGDFLLYELQTNL